MNSEEMINKLLSARKEYYTTGKSSLTDQEYDSLEESVRQTHPEHPLFEKVGDQPSPLWKKATHNIPMGSLHKCHTKEDFLKWAEKFKGSIFEAQYKLDGLSVSLNYEDSKFISAITRGDGFEGELISANVMRMKGFKASLPVEGFYGSVRAEILLNRAYFEAINAILPEDEQYSNPRNAAAGISRRLDGLYCKHLELHYYDVTDPLDESDKIEKLITMGLYTPSRFSGDIESVVSFYNNAVAIRKGLATEIDGVVIKVDSYDVQQREGATNNRPKAQIAWKFEPLGAATTLLGVTEEVGRTGVITPLGQVEEVEIGGSRIKSVTLHNYSEIKTLGLGIGDTVMLVKAGDVIPYIQSVIEHKGATIEPPTNCPSCQHELYRDGIKIFCLNGQCPEQNLQRIIYWIKTVKIENFGGSLVEKLRDLGRLTNIASIYRLKKEDISSVEGWGDLSADKIMASIDKSRTLVPEVFLSAVGIPSISNKTAEDLISNFGSLESIFKSTVVDLVKIKGFSDISATAVVTGLRKYSEEMTEILTYVNLKAKATPVEGGKLAGMSFCFTGAMSNARTYYQNIVNENGGRNLTSVIKGLTYLVCNEDKGSSKSVKAEKMGVKIINEDAFMELVS